MRWSHKVTIKVQGTHSTDGKVLPFFYER